MAENSIANITIFADLDTALQSNVADQCIWTEYDEGQEIVGHLTESRDIYFLTQGSVPEC